MCHSFWSEKLDSVNLILTLADPLASVAADLQLDDSWNPDATEASNQVAVCIYLHLLLSVVLSMRVFACSIRVTNF